MKFSSSWLPFCMDIGWGHMRINEGEEGRIASLSLLITLCIGCAGRQGTVSHRGKDGMVHVTLFWDWEGMGTIVLKAVIHFFF